MRLSAEEITKKLPSLASGHGEDTEAEVEHVDGAALVELPSMTSRRRKGHLSR